MQLYVYLACAYPQKWYHKVSDLVRVKLAWGFSHSLKPATLYLQPNTNLSTATTLLISPLLLHLTTLLLSLHLHHTPHQRPMKPPNIPYKKTLYITNTIISSHYKKLLNTKIKPHRPISYYKTPNNLSESRLYSIDIIYQRQ